MARAPTAEEFAAYKGAHTHRLWHVVGPDWRCPACDRAKIEIIRWTTRNPGTPSAYKGWMAALHRHHDHGTGFYATLPSRFPETIVCDQCNSADGQAKRRCELPKDFSFSPNEIKQFISAKANGRHKVDIVKAKAIYEALFRGP